MSDTKLINAEDVDQIINSEIERTSSFAEHQALINVKFAICNLPTAFDLDKVAEQIRKATDEYGLVDYVNGKPMITKEQALEILKKGGIA